MGWGPKGINLVVRGYMFGAGQDDYWVEEEPKNLHCFLSHLGGWLLFDVCTVILMEILVLNVTELSL